MMIKIYNNIPNVIKNEKTTKSFLKQLRNCLIAKSYYSIREFLDNGTIRK
jgi:hypothetical protein